MSANSAPLCHTTACVTEAQTVCATEAQTEMLFNSHIRSKRVTGTDLQKELFGGAYCIYLSFSFYLVEKSLLGL